MFGHPTGLYVLFFTEMWERFSFYGMRALLLLYMMQALHYDTHRAGSVYGLYLGAVYLAPAMGGYLADRYLGQRRAITIGGFIMALGHFLMAIPDQRIFFTALLLIVLGCGLFKANISVIVGKLYDGDEARRDAGFSIFYMGINLGSALSPFICGWLGQRVGWHYGFAAAGVGMLLGQATYLLGQRFLGEHGLHPVGKTGADGSAVQPLTRKQWQRVAALCILALFGNIVFWACFEQAGGSMTIFAENSTNLHIDMLDWKLPSSWFLSANPLFIILLAPLFSWAWVRLAKAGREPSTPMKFVGGLVCLSLGFFALAWGGHLYDTTGQPVSMLWLTVSYFMCTAGELCVSPVGLSVVTKLAPARYVSAFMGLWFASMALGNWAAGAFTAEYDTMPKGRFFSEPAISAAVVAALLLLSVRPIRRLMGGVH